MVSILTILTNELYLLNDAFSEEQSSLSSLIDELTSLQSEVSELNSEVSELNSEIDAAKTHHDELRSEINAIKINSDAEINAVKIDRDARIENFSLKSELMLADMHKTQEEFEDCLILNEQQSLLLEQNSEQKRRLSTLAAKLLKCKDT